MVPSGETVGTGTGSGPDWSQQLHKVIRPVECLLFGPLNADQASDPDTARRCRAGIDHAPGSGIDPDRVCSRKRCHPLSNKCPFNTTGLPVALDVESQDYQGVNNGRTVKLNSRA